MKSNKKFINEIAFAEILITLWNGKRIIFAFISLFFLLMLGFLLVKKDNLNSFTSRTEIKPITLFQQDMYTSFNSNITRMKSFDLQDNIDSINKDSINKSVDYKFKNLLNNSLVTIPFKRETLLSQYIEVIEEQSILKTVIREKNLLSAKDYKNEFEYDRAISSLAASLKLLPPQNIDQKSNKEVRLRWSIEFEYNDKLKWLDAMELLNKLINEEIRKDTINSFQLFISNENKIRNYAIKDIDDSIKNELLDYNIQTEARLLFLDEQAQIARKLDIKKNTLEASLFQDGKLAVTHVSPDDEQYYYLRGYETIEKEIALLKKRTNKEAFITNLIELRQNKRSLEQYKNLDRIEKLFLTTPFSNPKSFKAASLLVNQTNFKNKFNLIFMIFAASLLGGLIGVTYIVFKKIIFGTKVNE